VPSPTEATGAGVTALLGGTAGLCLEGPVQDGSTSSELGALVEWLVVHRTCLSVLIHPDTGNDLLDRTEHAVWLGQPLGSRF
jgi:hypothetical protein